MSIEELVGDDVNIEQQMKDAAKAETGADDSANVVDTAKADAKVEVAKVEEKMVPLAALHESRQTIKEQRAELKAQSEMVTRANERMAQIEARLLAKAAVEIPKYEENPAEHLKARQDALEATVARENAATRDRLAKDEVMTTAQRQLAEFRERVSSQEAMFAKTAPDYSQAAAHVRDVMAKNLLDSGIPEEDIGQAVGAEITRQLSFAIGKGKNAAEVVYSMAKRMGYTPAASGADKLANIAKGQDAAKEMSGGKPEAGVSLETLANMDESDLDAMIDDPKKWRQLMTKAHQAA